MKHKRASKFIRRMEKMITHKVGSMQAVRIFFVVAHFQVSLIYGTLASVPLRAKDTCVMH